MNTIHSSSIAYYPAAYPKQQTGNIGDSKALANNTGNGIPAAGQGSVVTQRPATTELKTALAEAESTNRYSGEQPKNSRTQQALNAYTQNYNQVARRGAAEIVSRIDTYA